jgi:hypothetical protein
MGPLIGIVIALAIRGLLASRNGKGRSAPTTAQSGRPMLWGLLLLGWIGFTIYAVTCTLMLLDVGAVVTLPAVLRCAFELAVTGAGACVLFLAWPILRRLARGGRPKLVYYLAQCALLFPRTGETHSGASLLALLALAHRGNVTKDELDWVQARLRKETHYLGTYATACALHLALRARLAADAEDLARSQEWSQHARIVLGTITYVSDNGVPDGVRQVAYELLGLDDARLGRWGSLEIAPEKSLTPLARVLRGWTRERLMDKPAEPKVARLRRRLATPTLDELFNRPREFSAPGGVDEVSLRVRRHFVTLVRGGAIGPRHILNLLGALDALLHPKFKETLLPAAVRDDDEIVTQIHEEVARTLAGPIAREGAPLFAMNGYGPISARVYQQVEAQLLGEMERALANLDARTAARVRNDPFSEWLEASYVRSVYRRLEHCLGPEAAAHVWPHFAFSYGRLGVRLSETSPRMRPLAYAVFKCLSGEAVRFDDKENIKQQAHNMTVTSGVE